MNYQTMKSNSSNSHKHHHTSHHKRTNGGTFKVHNQWRRRNAPLDGNSTGSTRSRNNKRSTTTTTTSNPNSGSSSSSNTIATTTATSSTCTTNNHQNFKHRPFYQRRQGSFGIFSHDWNQCLENSNRIEDLEESLHRTLHQRGVYESPEGLKSRTDAVEHLDEILQQWNKSIFIQKTQTQLHQRKQQGEEQEQEQEQQGDANKDSSWQCSNDIIYDPFTFAFTAAEPASSIKLISFGSYRLGVNSPHADLDLLAICPSYISKDDFFHLFVEVLRQDSSCTAIHPVAKAYTPVIKFEMNGIPIDLLFVRLSNDECLMNHWKQSEQQQGKEAEEREEKVRENDQQEHRQQQLTDVDLSQKYENDHVTQQEHDQFQIQDEMLQGLDEPSSRSLNGVRVAQYLLNILSSTSTTTTTTTTCTLHACVSDEYSRHPKQLQEQVQLHSFRMVLRTVKEWAKVHGLYSNVLGFLGGVNWAILVAWVCKRNPDASIPLLLKIFFHTFARWRWPKPVILTHIVKNPPQGVAPLTIWDPANNPRDRAHIMPIITPCYPSMNSSYNVSLPQLRRIREELYRADTILDRIASGELQWKELFKDNDFFTDHVHYLQIKIISQTQQDHRAWFGLCESRLRILIAGLESVDHGTHAYPFAKFFTRNKGIYENHNVQHEPQQQQQQQNGVETPSVTTFFFIALRFAHGIESIDLIGCCSEFVYSVNSWEGRKKGMDLQIDHVLQRDLPAFVCKSDSMSKDVVDGEDKSPLHQSMDGVQKMTPEGNFRHHHLKCNTLLRDMVSPDDCLASPLKKTKIGKA